MYDYAKPRRVRCRGCGAAEPETRQNPQQWWLPGVIVVEFKQRMEPDQILGSPHPPSQEDLSWLHKFRQILHDLPIKPPKWTFSFRDHGPPIPNYERFLTFYLHPHVNVPQIAKALSELGGVMRASGEPRLAPPKQRIPLEPVAPVQSQTLTGAALLDEPLAVPGSQSFGLEVFIGQEQFANQWYLFRTKAHEVLKTGVNGAGVVVADVDWGFHVNHQEFAKDKIKFKYNAQRNNDEVSLGLKTWHGTASLGLIGAGDNNTGMLGFAPGADLWAIQAQDDSVIVDNGHWGNAIIKAYQQPSAGMPKVILVEVSTDAGYNAEWSLTIREPIKQAIAAGCVVCVTAGNVGEDAGLDENGVAIEETGSILVGATQYSLDANTFARGSSNWGPRVLVCAPAADGSDVTCCACEAHSYTNSFGGTSGAGAKVAGAMALLLQTYPQLTHQQIVQALGRMPRVTTLTREPLGCFLDIPLLRTKAFDVLSGIPES